MRDALEQRVQAGHRLSRADAVWLFNEASDEDLRRWSTLVRDRRHEAGVATYLIMAIVNTTNVCVARCDYCAFYRLPKAPDTYLLSFDDICERIDKLCAFGGTMVGFNGGFHPKLRIIDYARLFARIRERYPKLEFYETTVAEFMYACKVSRLTYAEGARVFADHGVRWVTGGGAEVLDEAFRERHSPLKFRVSAYFEAQKAILEAGLGSTATMVIGFDETLDERMNHLEALRRFQDDVGRALPSFLCWTYKPWNTELGGREIDDRQYMRWLATCRLFLDNFNHIRTSVLTRNEGALVGLQYGANDFDIPTEDEVTQLAGGTVSHDFSQLLNAVRESGYTPQHRVPWPPPTS